MTHQLAGTVVHNREPFPTAFPPSGTLTDVSLSYQSRGTVPKHFIMKMQRRDLFPPAKDGQLSEVTTAGGHADGTRGAPSAHHAPEEEGCPLPSCSRRGQQGPRSASRPGARGPCQVGGGSMAVDMAFPRACHAGEEGTAPGRWPFAVPACSLLFPLLRSSLSVAAGSETSLAA